MHITRNLPIIFLGRQGCFNSRITPPMAEPERGQVYSALVVAMDIERRIPIRRAWIFSMESWSWNRPEFFDCGLSSSLLFPFDKLIESHIN